MTKSLIIGIILLTAFASAVVFMLPQNSICTDEIRGFEQRASSSIEATRKAFDQVKADASTSNEYSVPQLEGLNAANLSALKACDTHCKLLSQCLRFVYFEPPSEACPNEYSDYKEAVASATDLFYKLEQLKTSAINASKAAAQLAIIKRDIKELEFTSGSTGGRIVVLQTRAEQSDRALQEFVHRANFEFNDINLNYK